MPLADSTSMIFQCLTNIGQSSFSRGQAKPTAIRKAPSHREYESVTGGTCPTRPRPRTMLPAQNRLAAARRLQAECHSDRMEIGLNVSWLCARNRFARGHDGVA